MSAPLFLCDDLSGDAKDSCQAQARSMKANMAVALLACGATDEEAQAKYQDLLKYIDVEGGLGQDPQDPVDDRLRAHGPWDLAAPLG